jgi:hypothetical protein
MYYVSTHWSYLPPEAQLSTHLTTYSLLNTFCEIAHTRIIHQQLLLKFALSERDADKLRKDMLVRTSGEYGESKAADCNHEEVNGITSRMVDASGGKKNAKNIKRAFMTGGVLQVC